MLSYLKVIPPVAIGVPRDILPTPHAHISRFPKLVAWEARLAHTQRRHSSAYMAALTLQPFLKVSVRVHSVPSACVIPKLLFACCVGVFRYLHCYKRISLLIPSLSWVDCPRRFDSSLLVEAVLGERGVDTTQYSGASGFSFSTDSR